MTANYTHIMKTKMNGSFIEYDSSYSETSLTPNYITNNAGNQYIVTRISLDVSDGDYLTIAVLGSNTILSLYFGVPDIKELGISAFYNNYPLRSVSNNTYSYSGRPSHGELLRVFGNAINSPLKVWLSPIAPPF